MKSFLLKNTKNDKVNNWGIELASKYTLNFEYVKGIKNTLADTMSRLVTLDPDITLIKEPEGYQFCKQIKPDNTTDAEVKLVSLAPVASATKTGNPMDPVPDKDMLHWGISSEEIIQRQKADKFCKNIRDRIVKTGSGSMVHPYYIEEELLMHYVEDNKQRFEVIVIPRD